MKAIVDKDIPFISGRLEKAGIETLYVDQWGFTPENVREADMLIIRTRTRCDEALLEGSKVRLVATATIGMDQIDLDWCAARGIKVRNAPGCNAPGVAQYVWSALLRLGIGTGSRVQNRRQTLGIVGCGNVGSIVRDWAERLGVRVIVSDPPKGMDYPLERLLAESDAVTLHTPLVRGGDHPTFHLMGSAQLSAMRPGTVLVNAARGPVVDFKALKKELKAGRIKAVIDTWEGEPEVDTDVLELAEYATFHIAGYSDQGKQRATRMVLETVEDTFGVVIDKSGLEPAYAGTDRLTAERILASYDPMLETELLRAHPGQFDKLRNEYNYRPEV